MLTYAWHMTDDELAVLTANDSFYETFARRDFAGMDELWAREHEVCCIHPGWSVLVGRDAVMSSWRAILRSEGTRIEPTSPRAYILGDAAYVVCFEGFPGEAPLLVATNVFAREGGAWRIVHHQAGQMAQAPEEEEAASPTN
jgi:SnoaL-like protein